MTVKVCIGSACHLKGSYEVIERLKECIEESQMGNQIHLKSSFCLGACLGGVSVQINDDEIKSLLPDDVDEFYQKILKEVT